MIGRPVRTAAIFASVCLGAACTAGGVPTSSGGGGGATHVVDVNLHQNPAVPTPYGQSGAMKPAVLMVSVGDTIEFSNSDSVAHTASYLGSFTSFPGGSPLTGKAVFQSGRTLSGGWTSGAMQPGSTSQTVVADKPGIYLYGCYFHYGAPMRGAIVAQ